MKKGSSTVLVTICVIMLLASAAMFCGVVNSEKEGDSATYFESLNDFDWSGTCPAAGCRSDK